MSSGKKERLPGTSPTDTFKSLKLLEVNKKETFVHPSGLNSKITIANDIVKKPEDNVKKIKKESVITPDNKVKKFKNINFTVNGSVVMISNWESAKQEILFINWDKGITDKKRIHKYLDYTSIPSSVKITFKDNSTKSYRVK